MHTVRCEGITENYIDTRTELSYVIKIQILRIPHEHKNSHRCGVSLIISMG